MGACAGKRAGAIAAEAAKASASALCTGTLSKADMVFLGSSYDTISTTDVCRSSLGPTPGSICCDTYPGLTPAVSTLASVMFIYEIHGQIKTFVSRPGRRAAPPTARAG